MVKNQRAITQHYSLDFNPGLLKILKSGWAINTHCQPGAISLGKATRFWLSVTIPVITLNFPEPKPFHSLDFCHPVPWDNDQPTATLINDIDTFNWLTAYPGNTHSTPKMTPSNLLSCSLPTDHFNPQAEKGPWFSLSPALQVFSLEVSCSPSVFPSR